MIDESSPIWRAVDEQVINYHGTKINIAEFTAVDENQLSEEYAMHASIYAYIGQLVAEAESEYNAAKLEKDIAYSEADADYRLQLDKRNEKYTETKIRGLVVIDGDYVAALEHENDTYRLYKSLRNLHDALKVRGDMLINLGAMLRAESDITGLVIKTKEQLRK